MLATLAIRFVLGGLIVSAFAVLGDTLRPKSFAGIFGAAPSVALASLGLAFITKGIDDPIADGRSMVLGAAALCVYCALVARLLLRYRWPVKVAAAASWCAWLAVALGLWAVILR